MIDWIFLALSCRSLAKLAFSIRILTRQRQTSYRPKLRGKPVISVTKIYGETPTVESHILYLASHIKNGRVDAAILVGSDRERDMHSQNRTVAKARNEIRRHGLERSIECIEATGEDGKNSAAQLNYAARYVLAKYNNAFLVFHDIDTRISPSGLLDITELSNNRGSIVQQSALFTRNIREISYWQRGHALLQSRWSVCHEQLRLRLSHHVPIILYHVVGHGFGIWANKLIDYGGWPNKLNVEDIELGFYLSSNYEVVQTTESFELSDSPNNVLEGLRQEHAWAFGAAFYPVYWINWSRTQRGLSASVGVKIGSFLKMLQGCLLFIGWNLVSYAFLYSMLALLLQGSLITGSFAVLYTMEIVVVGAIASRVQGLGWKFLASSLPAVILAILRRSIGANRASLDLIRGRMRPLYKSNHE